VTNALQFSMHWSDWAQLFLQYLMLSLLAFGSVIATAPDMHRYLVQEHGWLNDAQFNASIAIAQAAPGPNILFVALMGWQIGLNSGGLAMGLLGVLVTMAGILIPSSTLAYFAAQWGHRNRERRIVRAFKQGMAPVVIALLLSTGWILAATHGAAETKWRLWLLTAVVAIALWLTRVHLLWLLAAGALLGWFGLV
jgi:chromate transporter